MLFRSNGGVDISTTQTFTITVTSIPATAPVITEGAGPLTVTTDEDASPTPFALTLHATDINGDTLTWSISANASHGTATASGTGASKAINYSPTADWNGSDSFTVQVSDGALTDTIVVNVTVNPRNDAPVNTVLPSVAGTLAVGQTLTADKGTWNDAKDKVPGTLSYTYQWQRADDVTGTNALDISGATTATYVVQAADEGKTVRSKVTCSDNGESLPAIQSTVAVSAGKLIPVTGTEEDDSKGGCGLGNGLAALGFMLLLALRMGLRPLRK